MTLANADHLQYVGSMVVYFNRHNEAPRVWCVAADDNSGWEIAVAGVCIEGVHAHTSYVPRDQDEKHTGPPAAVIRVHGRLLVAPDGLATITE